MFFGFVKLYLFSSAIIMRTLRFMIGIIGCSRPTKYRIIIGDFPQILSLKSSLSLDSFDLFFQHYFINIFNIKLYKNIRKFHYREFHRIFKNIFVKRPYNVVIIKCGQKQKVLVFPLPFQINYTLNIQIHNISFINTYQQQYKMAHLDCTKGSEIQAFLDQNGGVAVVDCHATWCPPCKAIAPYVHKKNADTKIPLIKIDVDQAPEVSQAYKIQAMPTFLVIKGKWDNVILTVVGGGQANVDKVFGEAAKHK